MLSQNGKGKIGKNLPATAAAQDDKQGWSKAVRQLSPCLCLGKLEKVSTAIAASSRWPSAPLALDKLRVYLQLYIHFRIFFWLPKLLMLTYIFTCGYVCVSIFWQPIFQYFSFLFFTTFTQSAKQSCEFFATTPSHLQSPEFCIRTKDFSF